MFVETGAIAVWTKVAVVGCALLILVVYLIVHNWGTEEPEEEEESEESEEETEEETEEEETEEETAGGTVSEYEEEKGFEGRDAYSSGMAQSDTTQP